MGGYGPLHGKPVVYTIENKITGQCYVGSTVDFVFRRWSHRKRLRDSVHHSFDMQSSWDKYGEDNFEFKIIELVKDKADLLEREQFWIDNLDSEFNMCKFAGSPRGLKHTEKAIENMRKAHRGRTHWTLGKERPQETRDKMSIGMRRHWQENEHPLKGRKRSQETIDKMSIGMRKYWQENEHPLKGKEVSQETRDKISRSNKDKWRLRKRQQRIKNLKDQVMV